MVSCQAIACIPLLTDESFRHLADSTSESMNQNMSMTGYYLVSSNSIKRIPPLSHQVCCRLAVNSDQCWKASF